MRTRQAMARNLTRRTARGGGAGWSLDRARRPRRHRRWTAPRRAARSAGSLERGRAARVGPRRGTALRELAAAAATVVALVCWGGLALLVAG